MGLSGDLTLDEISGLPPEALALRLLRHLGAARRPVRRDRTIAELLRQSVPGAASQYDDDVMASQSAATMALVEAWQRLMLDGLIVNWPAKDPQYSTEGFGELFQLTRWGRKVLEYRDDQAGLITARRRLGVELHSHLAGRLQDAVSIGAFEQAALLALRAIEARVRQLAGEPRGQRGDRLTGTALMRQAFASDSGPLADPDAEPGERVGTMELFAGAFGAVRNGLMHTEVEWFDPVEAAEYVLFADLLMRLLDRAEHRLAVPSPTAGD